MFLGRRRRSREESPEWICESRCLQVSVRLHVFAGFLALKPFHDYSLCLVCILPQPAFYSQSAVCILQTICILPLVRSLQSAVRSPKSSFYTDRIFFTPVMHQSICLGWHIPGDGDYWAVKCPRAGTEKEGKCPVLRQHCNIFLWPPSQIMPF